MLEQSGKIATGIEVPAEVVEGLGPGSGRRYGSRSTAIRIAARWPRWAKQEARARETFEGLSYSNKRCHVLSIDGAKTEETRRRRIATSIGTLREGRPR